MTDTPRAIHSDTIPPAAQALMAQIAELGALPASGRPKLRVRGGGSKDFMLGTPTSPEPSDLSTTALRGVVAYEPSELVITALAGTPLADIEALLATQGQSLGFEPPHFAHSPARPTLGGAVACGLSGPARASVGGVRDFMLGVQMINGLGQWLRFGGQVMKNVAGYDLSRLMAGSWGGLGVVAEVSIKVLPVPRAQATLQFEWSAQEALTHINRWGGQPLALNASVWQQVGGQGRFTLRLSGAQAAVDAACAKLGGQRQDEAAAADFWRGWRNQSDAFFTPPSPDHALIRCSVAQSANAIALEHQAMEWHGGQRWGWATAQEAKLWIEAANVARGNAAIFIASKSLNTLANLQKDHKNLTQEALQARIQQAFDPLKVFDARRAIAA